MAIPNRDLVDNAKLAEQAERYEDMALFMKQFAESRCNEKQPITDEERNLLSVAYKNVVGSRRSAWRVIKSLREKEEYTNNESKFAILTSYQDKIEKELISACNQVMEIVDKLLDVSESSPNSTDSYVFFCKMKGDYYRYQAEIHGDTAAEIVANAEEAYKKAHDKAKELPSTNPIRLGLALNYSVFFYEIKSDPAKACQEAKQAFDEAIADLDELKEDSYKDSTLIMQLLRDNLTLWTSENNDVQDVDEK